MPRGDTREPVVSRRLLAAVLSAKPLKLADAEPPLRVFDFDHCAPQKVTAAPTTAMPSPITKEPEDSFVNAPNDEERPGHSARSNSAVGVWAAIRPGMAATTLASTSAPAAIKKIDNVGTLGVGTAWISSANTIHKNRPSPIPSGTPTAVPIATATLDCQATTDASWRRVNPSVFSRAKSRHRLRTEATRVSPRATTARVARAAPRTAGVVRIE